jgi:hypothetical protein
MLGSLGPGTATALKALLSAKMDQSADGSVNSTAHAGLAAGNSAVYELQFTVIFESDGTAVADNDIVRRGNG